MRTQIQTGHPLSPVIVQRLLFLDQVKKAYFSRFMSQSGDMPVFEKTDFTKTKGDTMTFGLRYRVTGQPILGNATVEGKEDRLSFATFQLTLERYRYAIMDDGPLTKQRFVGDIPTETRNALVDWGAELIDQLCMDELTSSPTEIVYGGSATSINTLTSGDLITPAKISELKVLALTRRDPKVQPLIPFNVDGKKYLVLLVSEDCIFDLKRNAEFQQAQREAMERGKDNPLFSGAVGFWDGVVIHSHDNVPVLSNGGSGGNVTYSKNILLGASALCWAWGERPSIVEDKKDYEEFTGYCWRMTAAVKKPKFDGHDYGSIAFICADTRKSGRVTNIR